MSVIQFLESCSGFRVARWSQWKVFFQLGFVHSSLSLQSFAIGRGSPLAERTVQLQRPFRIILCSLSDYNGWLFLATEAQWIVVQGKGSRESSNDGFSFRKRNGVSSERTGENPLKSVEMLPLFSDSPLAVFDNISRVWERTIWRVWSTCQSEYPLPLSANHRPSRLVDMLVGRLPWDDARVTSIGKSGEDVLFSLSMNSILLSMIVSITRSLWLKRVSRFSFPPLKRNDSSDWQRN